MGAYDDVPVFIIMRDRVTCAKQLVAWLEAAGVKRITLVDNDSTWGPLLEWYRETPHRVVLLKRNVGKFSPWLEKVVPHDEPYVVTDPDTIPTEECPKDAIQRFGALLDEWDIPKVGFDYRTDDVPDCYAMKDVYVPWESAFSDPALQVAPGVYASEIDTMFALYRKGQVQFESRALRTGAPYLARHQSCYLDSKNLSAEEQHYKDRCGKGLKQEASVGTWVRPEIAELYRAYYRGLPANARSMVEDMIAAGARWHSVKIDVPAGGEAGGVIEMPEAGIENPLVIEGLSGAPWEKIEALVAGGEWAPYDGTGDRVKVLSGAVALRFRNASSTGALVDLRFLGKAKTVPCA